ncbi:MAG: HAMP domain-containing sensor histidine kinase [Stellaceae bacterium]
MLLESYCSRLGSLAEHRYSSLALLEAKQQAEKAASVAHEAMLKARAADRAKSNFLANMAHELRTPLNAIIGFSELIKLDQSRMRGNYPEYAGHIHDAGTILLDIINGILDIARIEAGRILLQEELIAVGELIQSSISTMRPIAQRKSIEIDCNTERPSTMIYVDATKLKQVMLNLLSNAVKFTESGGRIQIDSVTNKNGDLVLSIRDTGIGIPPEQIERILQPFEQIADHLTREHEGTGLGLPIARALIELHGGELVLSSQPGAGTTARLRLPGDRVRSVAASAVARISAATPRA